MKSLLIAATALWGMLAIGLAQNWPQFRGPNGQGVAAEDSKPPIEFGPEQSLRWRTEVPEGHSSPVIWGDHVFLTSGNGEQLSTHCLRKSDGIELWRKELTVDKPEKIHRFNSRAAPTPVTDGHRVYAYFGSFGLISYDFEGEEIWRLPLSRLPTAYGTASSPIIWNGTVILQRDGKSTESAILMIEASTGKIAQTLKRPTMTESYSTPAIWKHDGLGEELVTIGNGRVVAYDLEKGSETWWTKGVTDHPITIPVFGSGLLFASSVGTGEPKDPIPWPEWSELIEKYDANMDKQISLSEIPEDWGVQLRPEVPQDVPGNYLKIRDALNWFTDTDKDKIVTKQEWDADIAYMVENEDNVMAIRPGGVKEVTETHLAWKSKRGVPEMPSPLFYRDRLWMVRNGGMVTCYNATGEMLIDRKRLGVGGHFCASPVASNGHVYAANESGTVAVFKAEVPLNVVARNELGERLLATPAIVGDAIYIRTEKHLWAFQDE